ncbi:hypothetical protein J7E71_15015 [Mesobacillus foraminis]|uniref:DUF6270 domain-containing protein n=1 Tax=Mesobacillus foraminis TaxID=279826 RepID=UPI001BEA8565|nr:DUF6270 domain-containing protein [Mesobacillus foraminis]MBT2757237.1 hypothetical protein [Mesobacillus foraminis]
MFTITKLEPENESIRLEFAPGGKQEHLQLELRYKDMERFIGGQAYFYHQTIKVMQREGLFYANIPMKQLLQESGIVLKSDQLIWLAVVSDGKDYPINGSEEVSHFNMPLSNSLEVASSTNKKNEMNFKLCVRNPAVTIKVNPGPAGATFQLSTPETLEKRLFLRKRVNKDAGIHSESYRMPHMPEGYRFEQSLLNPDYFKEEVTIFDFCMESKVDGVSIESFAKVQGGDVFRTHAFHFQNKSYTGELYQTKKGNLALKVTRKYNKIKIKRIEEIRPDVYKVILPSKLAGKAGLYRYHKVKYVSSQDGYTEFKNLELFHDGEDNSYLLLDLKTLFGEIDTNYEQRYRILIQTWDGSFYKAGLEDKLEVCHPLDRNEVWLEGEKVLNLFVRNKQSSHMKVGVLGSCYSRSHFNSVSNFYNNKDYKMIFKVGYSHFWPSVISMVSEPVPFDKRMLEDASERKAAEIKNELNKSIIPDLKEAAVDYLLIDFYVDAIHGVRMYENGAAIGVNPSVRSTGFYRNEVLKTTRQIDSRSPDFFSIWMKACDEFIARIQQFLPQERMVLNTGGLIDRYYDKNREVKSFIDEKIISQKELIYYNSTWDRMNHYFLARAPRAKVIDMKKYGYIGDVLHPSPFGPHHYESAYYRSLTGELARIVTFDKARENTRFTL